MASFSFFRIYPLETGIRLSWMFEGSNLAALPEYYIERSVDSGATWSLLNPSSPVDSWKYDADPLLESVYASTTLYRVVADVDGAETNSNSLTVLENRTLQEAALLHSTLVQLRNRMKIPGMGVQGSLVRRRPSGVTCTDCVDPATGEVYDQACSTCLGTGVVTGYYSGVEQYMEMLSLEDYDRQWRSLSDNYSSDARAVRTHLPCKWVEGDVWSVNNEHFVLTSQFKVEASLAGFPLTYTGIIDKLPADHPVEEV